MNRLNSNEHVVVCGLQNSVLPAVVPPSDGREKNGAI